MAKPPNKPPVLAYAKRLWIHGFVAGLVLVGLVLAAWFFLGGSTPKEEEGKAPPAAAPVPAAPRVTPPAASPESRTALTRQLEKVLAGLQQATRQKDLNRFFSLYSHSFPHLEEKRQQVVKSWQTYDYPKMSYHLTEVKAPGPDEASALVTWEVEAKNRRTGQVKELTRTYRVTFSRESGQWRIAALDPWE